jgi:hypothetical protein
MGRGRPDVVEWHLKNCCWWEDKERIRPDIREVGEALEVGRTTENL